MKKLFESQKNYYRNVKQQIEQKRQKRNKKFDYLFEDPDEQTFTELKLLNQKYEEFKTKEEAKDIIKHMGSFLSPQTAS